MSNNKKRAIQARMKKHGESYSTARMHVCGGPPEPRKRIALSNWVTQDTPGLPSRTMAGFILGIQPEDAESKPLIVVPKGSQWSVILTPSVTSGSIQTSFAAPNRRLACLYADDYLHTQGYSGPGVGPLPPQYPVLREREDTMVPSKHEPSIFEQGARCNCGYASEDIRDRHKPCPWCGGIAVIMAETLLKYVASDQTTTAAEQMELGSVPNSPSDSSDDILPAEGAAREARKEMRAWFLEHFKDPADGVPFAEGEYQYVSGLQRIRGTLSGISLKGCIPSTSSKRSPSHLRAKAA